MSWAKNNSCPKVKNKDRIRIIFQYVQDDEQLFGASKPQIDQTPINAYYQVEKKVSTKMNVIIKKGLIMKLSGMLIIILLSHLYALNLQAQMYEWTDEKGVKHYSNVSPTESADEVNKKQEEKDKQSPGNTRRPVEKRSTFRKKTFTPKADEPESKKDSPADDEQISEEDFFANLNLEIEKFPVTMDELISAENARLQKIKKYSRDNNIERKDLVQIEKNRLQKAIEDLEAAPLRKFGNFQIKRTQLTYYRYRLRDLENSPETYFGDSPE